MDKFIKNLVRGAGKILWDGFKKGGKVSEKLAFWDVVTEYDLAAEKFVSSRILKKFPSHGIVGEESGASGNTKNFWLIDPLDGTRGFSCGVPQFTSCLAFVSRGQIKNAAIYDPIMDEMFMASAGKGATLNGRKISVSKTGSVAHCIISMYMGANPHKPKAKKIYSKYIDNQMWSMKTLGGSQAAAYAAAGRTDAIIFAHGGGDWDRAPGALILKEAGARVTELNGRPYRWNSPSLVAANPILHGKLMKALGLKKL